MPMYDQQTFDPDLIPKTYKEDVKQAITMAVALGWQCHQTTDHSITIIAPPPHKKKYHFGLSGRSSVPMKRIQRDVIRFGDEEIKEVLDAAASLGWDDPTAQEAVSAVATRTMNQPMFDDTPPPKEQPVTTRKRRQKQEDDPRADATIVSERPMIAKGTEGKGYDSKTTIERKWSDGTTDYKCVACDYTSPNRQAVPAHWSNSHAPKGGLPKNTPYIVDVPDATTYRPRQSRIAALAAVIAERLSQGVECDPEELARISLYWVHEQTKARTSLAGEHEEMTPEEIVARIRMLIDDGSQFEIRKQMDQIAEQQIETLAQLEAAQTFAAEQQTRADAADARAEHAWENLRALRSIVQDLDDDNGSGLAG